jgi:hypothetical protein
MPYGNGQRLGETINPQLMRADYSGFTNAAAVAGNTFANIGQQIGGAIKQYGDDEKTIKKSAQMAKSIRDAIPELAGMANNALAELSNPDLSQRDRLAIAEGIQDSLKIGVMGLENNRSNALLEIQQAELDAKIAAAKNKGSVMVYTPAELDEYRKSGYDPKIVGRDQFGNLMVETLQGKGVGAGGVTPFMKDGVFGFAPQNPSSFLPTPRAGGNYSNPNDGMDASTMTDEEILAMAAATEMPGSGRIPNYNFARDTQIPANVNTVASPPRPGAVQQSTYAQRVINDVNNGFAYGNTGANVTPPTGQASANVNNGLNMGGVTLTVAPNQINGFNPNNITAEQAKLLQAVGEDKLIPSFDSKGQITAYAIPGTPAEQQQKLNSLAIKKAELDAEGEKRKNEGEDEKKLRLEDYKNSQANAILYNINNALTDISKVPQGEGFAGGAWRAALGKYVPNSSVAQLDQSLATINNVIASDSLYKMRIASPTGGALGNTSNADIELLKNSIVALNSVKDPKKLQEGLYVVQMRFLDTIHGTESERKAKLKSGNIDQESFDYVESLYPPIKINDRGQAVPRKTKEIDIFNEIEINPEIQKMLNQ